MAAPVFVYQGELLHQAAIYDQTDLLKSLLEAGAQGDVNSRDPRGLTPLHTAALHNSVLCLEELLKWNGERSDTVYPLAQLLLIWFWLKVKGILTVVKQLEQLPRSPGNISEAPTGSKPMTSTIPVRLLLATELWSLEHWKSITPVSQRTWRVQIPLKPQICSGLSLQLLKLLHNIVRMTFISIVN